MLTLAKTTSGVDGIEFLHRDVRLPSEDEILLEVKAAGLCGTDIQIYKWPPWLARRMPLPCVLGHEMGGVVREVGSRVTNVKVGDNVSLESHLFCGKCYQCLTDRAHLCAVKKAPGVDFDGVFAQFVTVPSVIAWVNPPEFPAELGALMEPLGIAVHASLEGTGVSGQTVVINGCGPIGLMNVAAARALGAQTIIAIEPNALRRKVAETMGADCLVDPLAQDVAAVVRDCTRGRGADVVVEYSGQIEGLRNCVAALTAGGDLRLCATPSSPAEYDFTAWKANRPSIFNIHGRRIWSTWVKAADLVQQRKVDLAPILSHIMPLSEGRRAFELVLAGQALKPILVP